MAYLGKTFKHERDENFEEFIASLDIPGDMAERLRKSKPSSKLEKNGDEYVLSSLSVNGTKVLKFKDGVEFEENIVEGIAAKTLFKVNGDVIVQEQKFPDGRSFTFKREFSPNKLTVTLTSSIWDGKAIRHYVAA